MRVKVFAVIDTNVLVSAIIAQSGYPYELLSLVGSDNVIPLYDKEMIREYLTVFYFDKLKLPEENIKDVMNLLAQKGIAVNNIETAKTEFQENDYIPFFEVKESLPEFNAFRVTHNSDDRHVVTPKVLIVIMEQLERFIKLSDCNYEKKLQSLIEENITTGKYELGKSLIRKTEAEMRDVRYVVSTLALEGMSLPNDAVNNLIKAAKGEVSYENLIKEAVKKYARC